MDFLQWLARSFNVYAPPLPLHVALFPSSLISWAFRLLRPFSFVFAIVHRRDVSSCMSLKSARYLRSDALALYRPQVAYTFKHL
jgi:hypothetical protein